MVTSKNRILHVRNFHIMEVETYRNDEIEKVSATGVTVYNPKTASYVFFPWGSIESLHFEENDMELRNNL